MCSEKKNIALLRSLDNISNISSINIRSLRDYKSRAVNTQLPHFSSVVIISDIGASILEASLSASQAAARAPISIILRSKAAGAFHIIP